MVARRRDALQRTTELGEERPERGLLGEGVLGDPEVDARGMAFHDRFERCVHHDAPTQVRVRAEALQQPGPVHDLGTPPRRGIPTREVGDRQALSARRGADDQGAQ
jgi:hypothetical protein